MKGPSRHMSCESDLDGDTFSVPLMSGWEWVSVWVFCLPSRPT